MKKILLLIFSLFLISCESFLFYSQAISGQLSIFSKRENIQTLVNDPQTDAVLRQRLESILSIRNFAETEMGLPVENNYSTYLNLERPFVVWNVFAAEELSLSARSWCYPIAGCVTYRGYFSESAANDYATRLANDGFDVYVGGVAAYSTLGWFADPVLNTIINREEHRLAALIFHELAHQLVYIPGDTEFNESFATAVELEGMKRWLEIKDNPGNTTVLIEQASRELGYRRQFVNLVQSYIPRLETLYESSKTLAQKRQDKAQLIEKLGDNYQILKQQWQGYAAYDGWFSGEINNAKINTVATYFNQVPAFEVLLAETNYQLPDFYQQANALADLPMEERQAALAGLTQ